MKAKVMRGKGFRGALNYALGDDKGAHIVGGNMSGSTSRELAAEFSISRQLRPEITKPVWHCSLALPAGESLSAEKWQAITDDFMTMMQLDENQFVVIQHSDTEHEHVHIIASRIGLDGSVWHGQWEAKRAINATQALEKKHGLTITPGLEDVDAEQRRKSLSKNEVERALRTGEAPARAMLQELVSEAARGQPTVLAFIDRLEAAGVTVLPNVASTGRLNGFAFEHNGINFKGSQLGKAFSWKSLEKSGVVYEQDAHSAELVERANAAKQKADQERSGATDRAGEPGRGAGAEPGELERREPDSGTLTSEQSLESSSASREVDQEQRRESSRAHSAVASVDEADLAEVEHSSNTAGSVSEAAQAVGPGRNVAERLSHWRSAAAGVADLAAPAATDALERRSSDSLTPAQLAKQQAWKRQAAALSAPEYRITLKARRDNLKSFNHGKERGEGGTEKLYSADEVEKMLPYLSRQNARGYDIYITPIDPKNHYIVVDDMTSKDLERFKNDGFQPALVLESSADNVQAVLKVEKQQDNEQSEANEVVAELNKEYGDPAFSGVIHPFRLAGFSNKKPGRGDAFTRLLGEAGGHCAQVMQMLLSVHQGRAQQRQALAESAVRASRAHAIKTAPDAPVAPGDAVGRYRQVMQRVGGDDLSRADWGAAKQLLKEGHRPQDVQEAILAASPNITERHRAAEDYADRTVQNALREPDVQQALQRRDEQERQAQRSRPGPAPSR